jgi:hypothetical protein
MPPQYLPAPLGSPLASGFTATVFEGEEASPLESRATISYVYWAPAEAVLST